MDEQGATISLTELLHFFMPLALTSTLTMFTHLLLSQVTGLVGLSKVSNLLFTVVFVLLFSHRVAGPAVAPVAQLVGCVCSGLILHVGRIKQQYVLDHMFIRSKS